MNINHNTTRTDITTKTTTQLGQKSGEKTQLGQKSDH